MIDDTLNYGSHPACPALGAFGRTVNDNMGAAKGDALRARYLADLAPRLVNTRSPDGAVQARRALLLADYAVRVFVPMALDAVGLGDEAATLRALEPVSAPILCQFVCATPAYAAAEAAEEVAEAIRLASLDPHTCHPEWHTLEAVGLTAARAAKAAASAASEPSVTLWGSRAATAAGNVVGITAYLVGPAAEAEVWGAARAALIAALEAR